MYYYVSLLLGMIIVLLENFESQIVWLVGNGWILLILDQYVGFLVGRLVLCKLIVIIFDDGYLDNWVYVYLILQKYGMYVVVFVVIGWMGEGLEWFYVGFVGVVLFVMLDYRGCEVVIYEQNCSDDVMMCWSEVCVVIVVGIFEVYCYIYIYICWLCCDDLDCVQCCVGLSYDLVVLCEVLWDKFGEVFDMLCWLYGDFDQDYIEVVCEYGFCYLYIIYLFGCNVVGGDLECIYCFVICNCLVSWLCKCIV